MLVDTTINKKIHSPKIATKELAVYNLNDKRKIRLSSNLLGIMGYAKETRLEAYPEPGLNGLRLKKEVSGNFKVHERTYSKRKNNPFETHIDIQSQKLIDIAIPSYTERLHFEIKKNEILITPLLNRTFMIRKSHKESREKYSSVVAMTGGVDVHCMVKNGFNVDTIIEYRPQEKRDKTNLTETGLVNAMANAKPKIVVNEDITKIDFKRLEKLLKNVPFVSNLHLSLQCDDFTNLKADSLKEASTLSLDTSRDYVYEGLRLIEVAKPATVLVENVIGFQKSGEGQLLAIKLRRWGYYVNEMVLDAREHDGLTSRKRYYLVASVYPNFIPPTPKPVRSQSIWPIVQPYLKGCRNVSHTNSIKKGVSTGRIRLITPESTSAPTVTKSQNRQTKDSIYNKYKGEYFLPSEALLKRLNGIPESMDFSRVSTTIASEIIGQSIEYPMHEQLIKSLKEHIAQNTNQHPAYQDGEQLKIFR